ncbi:hypothetical protein A1O7_09460 [Cladophialophora yegresii CBS 114405]|uniref:Uncharacterized protein n=1 Tax=Cladophialophora yegresii CBS 114405 TaxID=1182544 RepID=W9VF70_9EURO|nr:uncharacterized protein A1O7_09460 [Cladophialophora yegresii CBS 114405]EXJ54123.1 hypothetical protein A1O7_09460 [Cladophialophora yegresii CBS 114405]
MEPLTLVNDAYGIEAGRSPYADNDLRPTQEEEQPTTAVAGHFDVEQTPTTKHARQYVEGLQKASQVVVSSRRLQLPSFQDDFLNDGTFSFMPVHQQVATTQPPNGPLTFETPSVTRKAGSGYDDLADYPTSARNSESRLIHEANITSEQLPTVTPRDRVENTDDQALTPQHGSSGFDAKPAERKQELGKHISYAQEEVTQGAEDIATEDCDTENEHTILFHGRDETISAGEDVQPGNTVSTYAPLPQLPEQGHNAGNDEAVGCETSPSTTGNTRTHYVLHSRAKADTAPIHDGRASKAPRRRQPRPVPNLPVNRHDNARGRQRPSEEDLLFLLMSRARENKEARTRTESLELENKHLRQEKLQSDAELRRAINAHDECIEEYDLLTQNLENFREKYYKLKKWALETNKDCQELQGKASAFEKAISDLTKDRDQLMEQLQDARSASTRASEQMASVHNGICEVRLMAEERLTTINYMDGLFRGQAENLSAERQRCNRLEQHIVHLEHERDKQNTLMHSEQEELEHTLRGLSDSLKVLRDSSMEDSLEKRRMLESLGHIRSILDTDVCKRSDVLSLKDTLETARTSLSMVEKSISQDLQATVAHLRNGLRGDISAHLDKVLSAIPSDTGQLNEVSAALARLEQKAGQIGLIVKLLQDARTTAEKEGSCLRGIADNLEKALDAERKAAQKTINDLTTNISEWRIKYQAARSEVERSKRERQAEMDENQAELNDLLAFLSEASDEQNSLRSELSKAEDFFKAIQQQHEQDHYEAVGRDDFLKCQLSHLHGQIDNGAQERARAREKIQSLTTMQTQLRQELKTSRGETTVAIREQDALHDEIIEVERRLDWTQDKLQRTAIRLQEVEAELGVFQQWAPSAEQLKKDFLAQEQEIQIRSQKVRALQELVKNQQARYGQLAEQAREKDRLVEEKSDLEEQLKLAREEASVIPGLQNELAQKKSQVCELELALVASQREAREKDNLAAENATINNQLEEFAKKNAIIPDLERRLQHSYTKVTELESALEASHGQAQENERLVEERAAVDIQMRELQKEKSALTEVRMDLQQTTFKVAELKAALFAAQDEVAKVEELQKTNTSLKQDAVALNLDLDAKNKECAQIGALKDIITAKDDELAELRKHLVSLNELTDELERLRDDRERMEGKLAAMQQQILHLEGALSNAKLDQGAKQAQVQRTGGDQSATRSVLPDSQLGRSHLDASRNGAWPNGSDPLALSAGILMVSETQLEVPETVPVGPDGLLLLAGQQQEDSDSDLSPVPSEDEDHGLEDEIGRRTAGTQPHIRGQGYFSPVESVRRAANGQESLVRPSSSSYSSQGDQMLLDQVSQEDASGADSVAAGTALNTVMPFSHLVPGQGASPRRLRSGSQGQRQRPTATPEPSMEHRRNRASTPAVRREQHQPNSAAKRRMEPEGEKNALQENTRRLKRSPANLDVTSPQHRASTQAAQPTASRGSGRWRKSSSIVGTNAPAPGRSQRPSKQARKGSRQDRYTSRFAPKA